MPIQEMPFEEYLLIIEHEGANYIPAPEGFVKGNFPGDGRFQSLVPPEACQLKLW